MYLRFRAGEVIRVWSKDEKGWWDGEITTGVGGQAATEDDKRAGPRRGWFPSNYVKDIDVSWGGTAVTSPTVVGLYWLAC
jgi:hypothetical protein